MFRWPLCMILVAVLALTLGLAACGDDEDEEVSAPTTAASETEVSEMTPSDGAEGPGNVVTQEMDLADFTAVEVENAFVVDVTESDSFSVTVRVDDDVLDLLDVSKVGDALRIRLKRASRLRNPTLEASVTMPALERLTLSGASRVSLSGFATTDPVDLELSGASTLDGDLEAGSVDLEASGASRVALEGSAAEMSIIGSGASTLDLEDFAVDTAEVDLSGASEATINVQERIDPVDVSGASRLRYLGDPALGDVSTSGGGTIDKVGD